jgi:hypothetical protein
MNRRNLLRAFGTTGLGLALGGTALAASEHHAGSAPGAKQKGPLDVDHIWLCGIHTAKKDPKIQMIAQHYCAPHTGDGDTMFQCVLFDTADKNAKLLGVEYVITDKTYRHLPDEEKKYWHPHTYEVLGGGLIAPGMEAEEEKKLMKTLLTTWGKAWHTWPDHKSALPRGEPFLIWSLTATARPTKASWRNGIRSSTFRRPSSTSAAVRSWAWKCRTFHFRSLWMPWAVNGPTTATTSRHKRSEASGEPRFSRKRLLIHRRLRPP